MSTWDHWGQQPAGALGAVDHLLFVVIALIGPLIDHYWFYPSLRRSLGRNDPNARLWGYRTILVMEWVASAAIVMTWAFSQRPWGTIGLIGTSGLRVGIAGVLATAYLGLILLEWRSLARHPERLQKVWEKQPSAVPLVPRTSSEHRGFMLVALTAGICEEFIYRGFIMWYLTVWAGPIIGLLATSLLFGFAHIYLGLKHVYRTATVGLVFGTIALCAGMIWPSVVVHAAMDLVAGDLGYGSLGPGATGEVNQEVENT